MAGSIPASKELTSGCVASPTSYATHSGVISSISAAGALVGGCHECLDGFDDGYTALYELEYILYPPSSTIER